MTKIIKTGIKLGLFSYAALALGTANIIYTRIKS